MSKNVNTHYVARVVVERVDNVETIEGSRGYEKVIGTDRTVNELGSFTIKGVELDNIKSMIGAHANLIDDLE